MYFPDFEFKSLPYNPSACTCELYGAASCPVCIPMVRLVTNARKLT